jgi:hypothetical protein
MGLDKDGLPVEGNFLRRGKRTFNISSACDKMLDQLAYEEGLTRSGVIEVATRRLHRKRFGRVVAVTRRDVFHERDG